MVVVKEVKVDVLLVKLVGLCGVVGCKIVVGVPMVRRAPVSSPQRKNAKKT